MSKPFPYWLRLSIVSSLSVLLSFNPAFAGRVIHRSVCGSGFRVPSVSAWASECCVPAVTETECCVPAVTETACCGSEVAVATPCETGCDCGGSTVNSTIVEPISVPESGCGSATPDSMTMPSPMQPAHPSDSMMPSVTPEASPSPSNTVPDVVPKAPVESTEAAPPLPKNDPVEPKEEPKVEPKVEPETEAPKPPADDLFAPPSTPPAAPKDDLFSPPATNEPSAMPATPPADDLFAPAPEPSKPAAPPADDLFAPTPEPSKPAAPPADDLFSTPPAMKTDAGGPASDDIFGNAPAGNTPAPATSVDDLFGAPPAQTPPASPPGGTDLDNLFKSTEASPKADMPLDSAKPVSTDVDSGPNFDDLFANPAGSSKVESPNTKSSDGNPTPSLENQNDAGFDNLFKSTSNQTEESSQVTDSAFRGAEFREWVDNTGDYSVKARLVVIYPDRVRLIKENGKFTSVPMSRLCNADRDYVNWVAVSLSKGPAAKFVNTETDPANNLQEMAR